MLWTYDQRRKNSKFYSVLLMLTKYATRSPSNGNPDLTRVHEFSATAFHRAISQHSGQQSYATSHPTSSKQSESNTCLYGPESSAHHSKSLTDYSPSSHHTPWSENCTPGPSPSVPMEHDNSFSDTNPYPHSHLSNSHPQPIANQSYPNHSNDSSTAHPS